MPSGGGEGHRTQPRLRVRRAERRPSSQVWFFVSEGFFFGLEGGAIQGPRGRGRNLWVWRRSVHRCQTACPSIRPFNQVFSADNGQQRRRLDGSKSSIPTSPMRRFDEQERFKQEQIRLISVDLKKSTKRQERRCSVAGKNDRFMLIFGAGLEVLSLWDCGRGGHAGPTELSGS